MPVGYKMVWFEKEVMNAAKIILRNTSKEVARAVMADAKKILKQKAKTTTERGLLSQFDIIPSKFDETSFLVWCQGPRKWWPPYHASFVELGGYSMEWGRYKRPSKAGAYIPPKPFLNPARIKNKNKAQRMYQKAIDKL